MFNLISAVALALLPLFSSAPSVHTAEHIARISAAPKVHVVAVERVQQVEETVIAIPRTIKKRPVAAAKAEQKLEVRCAVRELMQGSGLVRTCEIVAL